MLTPDEVRAAADVLRRLVAAAEAGQVECEPVELERLRGSLSTLEHLVPGTAVSEPTD